MKPTRKVSRRSFLATVAGGAVAGAAEITVASESAIAQTGVTNSDPYDPGGTGRTGITNSDPSDRPGYGRRRGGTDSDPYDAPGRGRGRTGYTDSDPSDPAGGGRGGGRRCTDSDVGSYRDPIGRGRRC